jgi:hypothetical protein
VVSVPALLAASVSILMQDAGHNAEVSIMRGKIRLLIETLTAAC